MTRPRPRHLSLVAQLGEAKAELDKAQERYDQLADRARTELTLGHHFDGPVEVLLTRNRTWDKDKALENFGDEICTLQVDLKMARFVMTGAEFERYYVDGPPKVIVRDKDAE